MKKKLRRSQKFDIAMSGLEIFYFFFPWVESGGIRYNIPYYLFRCFKTGNCLEVYQKVFLPKMDHLWGSIGDIAVEVVVICIFITAVVMLDIAYLWFAMEGKKFTMIPKIITMPLLLVLIPSVVEVAAYDEMIYSLGLGYMEWHNLLPAAAYGYFIIIVILEGLWLIGSRLAEELDEASRLLEEEKKRAEIQKQEILESYIGNLEKMIDETRAFQHDYKNILATMAGFIRENQMDELREFFYKKIKLPEGNEGEQAEAWKYLKNIYPMELKGFLYEKILAILTRDICVQVQSSEHIRAQYPDMEALIRVLGIFIDNAVEEAERLEDGQVYITIIKTEKGVLFGIENNYAVRPEISEITKKGYSTKGEGRGLGLYLAQEIIRTHADMVHELRITEERIMQQLEIMLDE